MTDPKLASDLRIEEPELEAGERGASLLTRTSPSRGASAAHIFVPWHFVDVERDDLKARHSHQLVTHRAARLAGHELVFGGLPKRDHTRCLLVLVREPNTPRYPSYARSQPPTSSERSVSAARLAAGPDTVAIAATMATTLRTPLASCPPTLPLEDLPQP